jgi:hypothetical protein
MKILDKKERVIDFKLTPYGRYKLSIGTFKPVYYAFYDAGIIYDGACAGLTDEKQNDIHPRIKDNTQFFATQALFGYIQDEPGTSTLEEERALGCFETFGWGSELCVDPAESTARRYFSSDMTPQINIPAADFFKFDAAIGDAYFDGPTQQSAPAWKIVTLEGEISGSTARDVVNDQDIPQIDITLNYVKKVDQKRFLPDPDSVYEILGATPAFADDRVIRVIENNMLVYAEEINTDLLTENFEIEVFLSASDNTLQRKFFENQIVHVVDGYMTSPTPEANSTSTLTTSSVEYYFDVFTDSEINRETACRGASTFNRGSYYIDLDFDCNTEGPESVYYDIYGSAVGVEDVEICQT